MPASHPSIIESYTLDTAEDLLAELSPATGRIWRRDGRIDPDSSHDWFFRGEANAEPGKKWWPLMPSAFRPGAFLPFQMNDVETMPGLGARAQRIEELHQVMRYASLADRHGFVVPGDHPDLRDPRALATYTLDNLQVPHNFPPPHLVAMVALAQHYGVPTRLLDWTWKPLVAAYFAAVSVAKRRWPGETWPEDGPFSVWAMNKRVVKACLGLDHEIHILSVPTATNPNLHAQGGHFSLVQPIIDEHPLLTVKAVLERHRSQILSRGDGALLRAFPLLVEFRVPAREARTLMLSLSLMGVTAASIYPGLGGSAKALEEVRFYEWAKPGERS